MAAGSGAASGHGARSSSTALEATLDRRFQGVSNTMESIQGLSNWCIENKKHHALIVRYWMKWLKKSDNNHRLNLFYLANDVIQNCKRKNAVVFRSAFGEVLSNAAQFIRDGKVRKSVERIFSIWEERSVYPEEVISQFKAGLNRKEKEREKPKEKEKDKEKQKVAQPANAQTNTKAALKSKIVAEFTPHSLVEQLSQYQRVVAEEELREKQLGSLRVDACSTEALKRLKDKAEGNKFAKDFEDNTEKLQEFVTFLDKELKTAPPLLEALGNADIFYEMQYKEVKIVANAYNAFANRVTSLKRKLDLLKPTLHGTEDSPIPSPSEDAPSPTGSDSPFLGLDVNSAQVDPELDGKAMDDGEMQSDTRDMEDMDVSDEDTGDKKKDKSFAAVAKATKVDAVPKTSTTPTKASKVTAAGACTPAPSTSGSTLASAQSTATAPLGVGLEKVDLGKISSILSSLTSAMKNTAASPAPSSTGTPTTPSGPSAASKVTPTSPALASILSRVDITPEGILNALSKSNTPGLSSLLQNVTNTSSVPPTKTSPESSSSSSSLSSSTSSVAATGVKTLLSPPTPKAKPLLSNSFKRDMPGRGLKNSDVDRCLSPPPPPPPPLPPRLSAPVVSPPSLESKINSFLQGNPGFSLALGEMSPDGVDGTPVRDEGAGTPTQDEMMDLPSTGGLPQGHSLSPTAYRSDPWDAVITPSGNSGSNGDFNGSSAAIRFGASGKNNIGKDDDSLRKGVPSPSSRDLKRRRDSEHGAARPIANRMSMVPRKTDSGGPQGEKAEDKRKGQEVGGEQNEGRYHRIETLVSPCAEGAPIQALKYSNRPVAGERIKTVESIRVVGRGSRREGGAGSRPSSALWFDEEAAAAYMEPQPPTPPRVLAPPLGEDGSGSGSGGPPPMPQPLPHLLLPPHLHPHPPLPPQGPFPPLPYHLESMPTPPPPLLLPHPPSSPFLSSPPPIPRPPPPPLPQQLSPSPVPSAVMVGGVLVPVDLPIAATRLDADRGRVAHRGGKAGPPPLMSSLLGEPPKLPRKGTVKEAFGPPHHHHHHHQNPPHQHHRHHHHRHPSPGGAGVPVPLLGRVKEPLTLPLPSPSPTSSTTPPSTPSSPALDATAAPPLLKPPSSPPAPPRSQPASGPVPLLDLPTPRPPFLSLPVPQRPLLRGRAPTGGRDFSHGSGFRGTKRSGPLFSGGAYHGQKRPYLPPRY